MLKKCITRFSVHWNMLPMSAAIFPNVYCLVYYVNLALERSQTMPSRTSDPKPPRAPHVFTLNPKLMRPTLRTSGRAMSASQSCVRWRLEGHLRRPPRDGPRYCWRCCHSVVVHGLFRHEDGFDFPIFLQCPFCRRTKNWKRMSVKIKQCT